MVYNKQVDKKIDIGDFINILIVKGQLRNPYKMSSRINLHVLTHSSKASPSHMLVLSKSRLKTFIGINYWCTFVLLHQLIQCFLPYKIDLGDN